MSVTSKKKNVKAKQPLVIKIDKPIKKGEIIFNETQRSEVMGALHKAIVDINVLNAREETERYLASSEKLYYLNQDEVKEMKQRNKALVSAVQEFAITMAFAGLAMYVLGKMVGYQKGADDTIGMVNSSLERHGCGLKFS